MLWVCIQQLPYCFFIQQFRLQLGNSLLPFALDLTVLHKWLSTFPNCAFYTLWTLSNNLNIMTCTEACIRCKEEILNKYIFNKVLFPHEALCLASQLLKICSDSLTAKLNGSANVISRFDNHLPPLQLHYLMFANLIINHGTPLRNKLIHSF